MQISPARQEASEASIFCHVRLSPAVLATIKAQRCILDHQRSRLDLRIHPCDWKLHALILANGSIKHYPVARISRRFINKIAAISNTFCSNQNSFSIHPIEDDPEALSFPPDQIAGGGHKDHQKTVHRSDG